MEFPEGRCDDISEIRTSAWTLVSGSLLVVLLAVFSARMPLLGFGGPFPWLPNALGLLLLLRSDRHARWAWRTAISLGLLVGNVAQEGGMVATLGLGLASVAELLLGEMLLDRMGCRPLRDRSLRGTMKQFFVLMSAPVLVGAVGRTLSQHVQTGTPGMEAFASTYLADAMGMSLLLFPGLIMDRDERKFWKNRRILVEVVLAAPLLTGLVLLLLGKQEAPTILAFLPCFAYAVWGRFDAMLAANGIAVFAIGFLCPVFHEWQAIGPDATQSLWMELSATFVVCGVIGQSIKEMRRQVLIGRSLEERFRAILDASMAGEVLVGRDGRVVEANRSFRDLVGERGEVKGAPLMDWIDPEDRTNEGLGWLWDGLVPNRISSDLRYRKTDGTSFVGRTLCSSIPGEDGMHLVHVEDVTSENRVEQELRDSKAELQLVIDSTPLLVAYWDSSLRNRFANRAYRDWLGIDFSTMPGRTMLEILGEAEFQSRRQEIEAVLEGKPQVFERESTSSDGALFRMYTFTPDFQDGAVRGFYSFIADVTPLRLAQKARLDALARLRDVIDGATGFSIIVSSIAGTIELFSAGAEKMLGYSSGEMVGKVPIATLHAKDELVEKGRDIFARHGRILSGFDVLVDSPRNGVVETNEWTYLGEEGRRVPVQVVASPLRDHLGRTNGFLFVARDISRDRDARRILEDARNQAERESRLKGEFVANMSHEIRTPMNAVLGSALLLEKTSLTPSQKRYLGMIERAGKSLLGILDNILDFAKIESGKLRIERVPFRLDDVLEHVANICALAAQGKRLDLSMLVDPELPFEFEGDPLRLQQVFVNLVGNAAKFTEHGGITFLAEMLARDGDRIEVGFRIRDTGIGLSDEQQRRIFLPFSQADESITRRFGGTGLGLPISKHLVESMGGRIGIHSKQGVGTEFFVSITLPSKGGGGYQLPAHVPQDLRLLVVDDDATTRQGIEWAALRYGWKVSLVGTFEEAMATLRAECSRSSGCPFAAILVDTFLPGWNDRDGLARLREACGREIPLIRLTDFTEGGPNGDVVRVLDGTLLKPVTPQSLQTAVCGLFDPKRQGNPAGSDEQGEPRSDQESPGPLSGLRILLVEDNQFNQVVATETLRIMGAEIGIADNGRIACDILATDPAFDVVLMDVQMPVMDGFAATRHIRTTLGLRLPVLAMTAGVLPSDRENCLSAGMDDFVTKPFQVEILQETILKHAAGRVRASPVGIGDAASGRGADAIEEPDDGVLPGVFEPHRMVDMLGTGDAADALVRRLVEQFLGLVPKSLGSGREAFERGDFEEAMRAYHNLKSTSASLGALALSASAKEAEERFSDPDGNDHEQVIAHVEKAFSRVERLANRWLSSQPR